jgi:hypothetical protein
MKELLRYTSARFIVEQGKRTRERGGRERERERERGGRERAGAYVFLWIAATVGHYSRTYIRANMFASTQNFMLRFLVQGHRELKREGLGMPHDKLDAARLILIAAFHPFYFSVVIPP